MTGPVLAGLVEAYVQVRGEDEGEVEGGVALALSS